MDHSPEFAPGDKPPQELFQDDQEPRPSTATPPHLVIDESNDGAPAKSLLDTIAFKPINAAERSFTVDKSTKVNLQGVAKSNITVTSPRDATGKIFNFVPDPELPQVPQGPDDAKIEMEAYYKYVDDLRKVRTTLITKGLLTPTVGRDFINGLIDRRVDAIAEMILDLEKVDNQLIFTHRELERLSDRRIQLVCELNGCISSVPPTVEAVMITPEHIISTPAGSILIPPAGGKTQIAVKDSFVAAKKLQDESKITEIGRAHV